MADEKTIVEQLSASAETLKIAEGKLATQAATIAALEKSVADLTAESAAHKASAEKAVADLAAMKAEADAGKAAAVEAQAKIKTLEARLADPSFKAAGAPAVPPVAEGGKVADAPKNKQELVAEYKAEALKNKPDKTLLATLEKQINQMK